MASAGRSLERVKLECLVSDRAEGGKQICFVVLVVVLVLQHRVRIRTLSCAQHSTCVEVIRFTHNVVTYCCSSAV